AHEDQHVSRSFQIVLQFVVVIGELVGFRQRRLTTVEHGAAGDDKALRSRIQSLCVLSCVRKFRGIKKRKGQVIPQTYAGKFLRSQLPVNRNCIFQRSSCAVSHSELVVFQKNGEVPEGFFVGGIQLYGFP